MSETEKQETSAPERDAQPSASEGGQLRDASVQDDSQGRVSLSENAGGGAEAAGGASGAPDAPGRFGPEEGFHSKWAAAFDALAKIGPLYILAFICLMVWPDYWQKGTELFCPPEIRSVTAFLHCVQESSWLAPTALDNGAWALPQWPLFYIFTGLLALIPGLAEANYLIPLATALAAAIAALGAFFFTHAAGFGSRAAFASALVLLCAPIFAPMHHFFGPVTLAAGLMLFSLAFFCRGWRAERAYASLPLAFICAGLAGLAGGVLYIAVPFIGSFFYLIWQGRYRRGQALDAIIGFLLMLALIGAWIGAVVLGNYPDFYLPGLFKDSLSLAWPPQPLWFLAFILCLVGSMPWTLSVFGVSWIRVLKDSPKSFSSSRRENGSALMWISLVLACCLSLFTPHLPIMGISLAALAAPLIGKALIRLSPAGNRFFYFLASLFVILAGCLLLALHFEASQKIVFESLPITLPSYVLGELQELSAVAIIGGVLILAGILGFFFARRSRGGGGMLYASVVAIVICQIVLFMIAPRLHDNPALPLKTMSAIAAEVEKAQAAVPEPAASAPAPAPTGLPPAPPQPAIEPPAPPASALPDPTAPAAPALPVQPAPEAPAAQDQPAPGGAAQPPEEAPAPEPAAPAPELGRQGSEAGSPPPSLTIPKAEDLPPAEAPAARPEALEPPALPLPENPPAAPEAPDIQAPSPARI